MNNDILYAILFLVGFSMIMVVVMKYFVSWYFQIGRIVGALEGINTSLKKIAGDSINNKVIPSETQSFTKKLEKDISINENNKESLYKKITIFGIVLLTIVLIFLIIQLLNYTLIA